MRALVSASIKPAPFVKPAPRRDSLAFTFLIAMALAAAVTTGAALNGVATGAVQDLIRNVGSGGNDTVMLEQRRQATTLAAFERTLDIMRTEVGRLAAQVDSAADAAKSVASAAPVVSPPVAAARPDPAPDSIAIAGLRASIDENEERTRAALAAVNKRVDWLETLVYSRDATGSISPSSPAAPSPPARRRSQKNPQRWLLLHADHGVAVIGGKNGAVDVTPGFVIPELGRVAEIRQRDGRWQVVTEKATITQR
jgi:hypothetical protein